MKFKFNKVILFIVVFCMCAASFVGCNKNVDKYDVELEATEIVEETEVVEVTEATEATEPIETEAAVEEAEPVEIEEDEEIDKNEDNSNNYNNTYDDNASYNEPSYDYEQEEDNDVSNDVVVEEIPEETIAEEEVDDTEEEVDDAESNLISMGNFKLTAYCACSRCCGEWTNGITATGTTATQGRTIAVDPNVIPYGTEVVINGNTYIAEDCGGAIKYNKIDIYFDSHQEALNFGVQYADVYIKE